MITHGNRVPVVTCPKCEAPYKLTRKLIAAAVAEKYGQPLDASECSIAERPVRYRCPHCSALSPESEVVGEDIESFDATAEE